MKYLRLLFFIIVGSLALGANGGCALVDPVRGELYEQSMKVFDEVDYRYHRKGNVIHRELMATGSEKLPYESNTLDLPGLAQ